MARSDGGSPGTAAWWHGFAQFVRHALHSTVDPVEPRPGGLESIHARIRAGGRRRRGALHQPAAEVGDTAPPEAVGDR